MTIESRSSGPGDQQLRHTDHMDRVLWTGIIERRQRIELVVPAGVLAGNIRFFCSWLYGYPRVHVNDQFRDMGTDKVVTVRRGDRIRIESGESSFVYILMS